jgi:Zincin-like metallopeptidase/Cornifin (SPRR) family
VHAADGHPPDPNHSRSPDRGHLPDPDPSGPATPDDGQSPDPGHAQPPDPGHGQSPDPDHGQSPGPGHGQSSGPDHGQSPDPNDGETPDPGHGQSPDLVASARPPRIRRRDRHGRGLRGTLYPPGAPLYRSRAQRFDDLVLQAVAQLEPRWHAQLAGIEFAVEEIPPAGLPGDDQDAVPLAMLDPGWPAPGDAQRPARPARIVVYRRPLLARADGEEELAELVLDIVVEEFARLLGVDPEVVDPDYPDA